MGSDQQYNIGKGPLLLTYPTPALYCLMVDSIYPLPCNAPELYVTFLTYVRNISTKEPEEQILIS